GITHILCLSSVIRLPYPDRYSYLRLPLKDRGDFDLNPHLAAAVGFIEMARQYRQGRVLVHCYQGKSRAAAVCIAYLLCLGLPLSQALSAVKETRPVVAPNMGFMKMLGVLE
ncbi:protein-tyrosine phosphatase-like protein, partial [Ochromonadaceae sp. CCMP2298]